MTSLQPITSTETISPQTTIRAAPERREYQDRGVLDILQALNEGKRPVYVLPTGAGKTIVAARVSQALIQYGKRIHFWVHRTELVDQAVTTLAEALPWDAIGQIRAKTKETPEALIQVAMVLTLANRIKAHDIARPDVVFIDEAHHARARTWETLLAWCPDAQVVGLTATPARLDGKGLHEHFDTLIQGPVDSALVETGHLAPVETLAPDRVQVVAARRNRETVTVADAVKAYQAHAAGRSAIFFGWDLQHSREVAAEFNAAGFNAAHVDARTPAPLREEAMDELRSGDLDIVCNHDIISEGFDAPDVGCIILGAPTASVVRYLQRCGRGRRPGDGKRTMILDLAGIVHYFGESNAERKWTLDDGVILPATGVLPFDQEDSRRDNRKPIEVADWELKRVGEWNADDLIGAKDVALALGISGQTLLRRMRLGDIPAAVIEPYGNQGRWWLRKDITEYLSSQAWLEDTVGTPEVLTLLGSRHPSAATKSVSAGFFPEPSRKSTDRIGNRWLRCDVDEWKRDQALWTTAEVQEVTGLSLDSLRLRRKRGDFPKPDKMYGVGQRSYRWNPEVVRNYIKDQLRIRKTHVTQGCSGGMWMVQDQHQRTSQSRKIC